MALVIASLGAGGAERVMGTLAEGWEAQGHQVSVITLSGRQADFYRLPPGVGRVALGLLGPSRNLAAALERNLRRLGRLRAAIRDLAPDIVISFVDRTNVLCLAATTGLGVPVIVAERIDPGRHPVGPVWALLRRLLYPRADALVVQTRSVEQWARGLVSAARVHVIPNPVAPPVAESPATRKMQVVAMGRLTYQKGFDLLVRAFARLAAGSPDPWRLLVLGDGEDRGKLEALAVGMGVADRVEFRGCVENPAAVLAESEIFVLSSRYEGFPNALLEAMAAGMAVIAADCPSGPSEIIEPEVNGVLAPPENVQALASALGRLAGDAPARRRLGEQARRIVERYSLDRVLAAWEGTIAAAREGRDRRRWRAPRTAPFPSRR